MAFFFSRYSMGVQPTMDEKVRVKYEALSKPQDLPMLPILICSSARSLFAFSHLMRLTYEIKVYPVMFLNSRAK